MCLQPEQALELGERRSTSTSLEPSQALSEHRCRRIASLRAVARRAGRLAWS
jgi:hypothetical protein